MIDLRARRRCRRFAAIGTLLLIPFSLPAAIGAAIGFVVGDYVIWRTP